MVPKLTTAGVIQPDVMIPVQQFPTGLKVGDFFDVLVGEIFSPGLFYVQLMQSLSYDLDDLVDEMSDTYGSVVDPGLEVSWEDLRVGLHGSARVEGEDKWYRVVVHRVNSITSVQVRLLDFGGSFCIPLSRLAWLLTQFCSLPAQALPAKLSRLAPPHGSSSWPQDSGARLLHLTRPACEGWEGSRGLVARLEEWGQGDKVELNLFDTVTNTEPKGVDIRKMLVEEGLARMVTKFKLSGEIKYLEEMLPTSKSYKYSPLRCPAFLCADQSDDENCLTNQSSELSEDTSMKTHLKSLLNLQNKVHSLVMKNVVTDEEEGIFCQMSALQTQYQALLARLLTQMARGEGGGTVHGRREGWRVPEESNKFQPGSWEDQSSSRCKSEYDSLVANVTDTRTVPTVTKLHISSGQTLHPVTWHGDCWVTSAEISSLNPHWRGYDLLTGMMQRKKLDGKVQSLQISVSTEEHLFQEMIVEGVGGLVNQKSGKLLDSVTFYKLADLENIMTVLHVNIGPGDLNKIKLIAN